MSTHYLEYLRQRRPPQGIPAREPFCAPKFLQRATELQNLEQLPWPRNLFGELASIAELMAESAHASEHTDNVCPCGCFDVIYFRLEACKNRWNQERRRRQVGDL
jgi:hypothetical protein